MQYHASPSLFAIIWLCLMLLPCHAGIPAVPLEPAFTLAADSQPSPVPLRWARAWMLVKVTINGADAGWFKLGTGYDRSCIDPKVAARLKLPMVSVFGLMKGVNEAAGQCYRVDGLQCGVASATDVLLVLNDMAEMSQDSVKMYCEGISGALGWDLLRTLPFVVDEPALQLEWQRVATPVEGATRVAVIEKVGLPFIEITAGTGCKTQAMLNSAEASVSIQRRFLRNHADQLWVGPVQTIKPIYYRTKNEVITIFFYRAGGWPLMVAAAFREIRDGAAWHAAWPDQGI